MVDLGGDIRVAGPQPLTVDHSQPTPAPDLDGEFRGDQRIGRMGEEGDIEPVGVQLPRQRYLACRTGPARGNDIDIVQLVGPASRPTHPDLDHIAHK